jgi:hypothetical protein
MKGLIGLLGLFLMIFSSLSWASVGAGLSKVDIDVFDSDSVRRDRLCQLLYGVSFAQTNALFQNPERFGLEGGQYAE